jgi:8-oxo-dGTP diphosphatase
LTKRSPAVTVSFHDRLKIIPEAVEHFPLWTELLETCPVMQIVTAAIIEKDGKILIAKRKKGGHQGNKWEFPGGKLADGEKPEDGLRRELREEFGIEAAISDFIASSTFHYPHLSIELVAYRATCLSGDFKLYDHEEIKWVLPSELNRYTFSEADIPIMEKISKGL